jgi:hypothetical protein
MKKMLNSEKIKISSWNIRGLSKVELQNLLKDRKLYIGVTSETKEILKGFKELSAYILIYIGVSQEKQPSARILPLIKKSREPYHGSACKYQLPGHSSINTFQHATIEGHHL